MEGPHGDSEKAQYFCPAFLHPNESAGCAAINLERRVTNLEYAINGNPAIPDSHGISGWVITNTAYMRSASLWAKAAATILGLILAGIAAYVAILEHRIHAGEMKVPALRQTTGQLVTASNSNRPALAGETRNRPWQ
jgi:hypothetical protein